MLGLIEPRQAAKAISLDLPLAVASKDLAQALSSAAVEQGKTCPVHVKVDTGMGRIGIRPSQARDFIRWLQELPGIKVEGVFSHFATADSHDKTVARQQLAQFTALKKDLEGLEIPNFHLANSAGILNFPQAHFSLVRPGIALYGLPPSQEREPRVKLEPALTWKARLNFIKELPPGSGISYGHTFHTTRQTVVGTVSVGYADGYSRLLSNSGQMLVGGRRVPVVGRVCMDPDHGGSDRSCSPRRRPKVGDEVVLIGRQGSEEITAEEVARSWAPSTMRWSAGSASGCPASTANSKEFFPA